MRKMVLLAVSVVLVALGCSSDKPYCEGLLGSVEYDPSNQECIDGVVYTNFIDARDNKNYKSVQIGTQIWMVENLNYNAAGSKCYLDYISNCNKYGKLYDWNTAMNACPIGWHLPSNYDWKILDDFAKDNYYYSSDALKTKDGWTYTYNGQMRDGNGRNYSGFSALPGGAGFTNAILRPDSEDYCGTSTFGISCFAGRIGYWWTSTGNGNNFAYIRTIYAVGGGVEIDSDYNKGYFASVRCIKN